GLDDGAQDENAQTGVGQRHAPGAQRQALGPAQGLGQGRAQGLGPHAQFRQRAEDQPRPDAQPCGGQRLLGLEQEEGGDGGGQGQASGPPQALQGALQIAPLPRQQ